MRIRTLYYTSVGMHPCNNLPYGESEDYNLTIVNCELVATIDSSQSASCVDAEDGYAHVNVTGGISSLFLSMVGFSHNRFEREPRSR